MSHIFKNISVEMLLPFLSFRFIFEWCVKFNAPYYINMYQKPCSMNADSEQIIFNFRFVTEKPFFFFFKFSDNLNHFIHSIHTDLCFFFFKKGVKLMKYILQVARNWFYCSVIKNQIVCRSHFKKIIIQFGRKNCWMDDI